MNCKLAELFGDYNHKPISKGEAKALKNEWWYLRLFRIEIEKD